METNISFKTSINIRYFMYAVVVVVAVVVLVV
jgi:hypothetical protein